MPGLQISLTQYDSYKVPGIVSMIKFSRNQIIGSLILLGVILFVAAIRLFFAGGSVIKLFTV